jgi:hypothetical protein
MLRMKFLVIFIGAFLVILPNVVSVVPTEANFLAIKRIVLAGIVLLLWGLIMVLFPGKR